MPRVSRKRRVKRTRKGRRSVRRNRRRTAMKGGMEGCAVDVVCGVDVDVHCPDCSAEQLRELEQELHLTPIPGSTFPPLAFGEQDAYQVDGGGKKKKKKTKIQSGGRYFTDRFITELKGLLAGTVAGAVSCRAGMILFLRWVAGAAVQRGTSNPLSIFTTWLAQISNLTCVCAIQLIWCFIYYIHFPFITHFLPIQNKIINNHYYF